MGSIANCLLCSLIVHTTSGFLEEATGRMEEPVLLQVIGNEGAGEVFSKNTKYQPCSHDVSEAE